MFKFKARKYGTVFKKKLNYSYYLKIQIDLMGTLLTTQLITISTGKEYTQLKIKQMNQTKKCVDPTHE